MYSERETRAAWESFVAAVSQPEGAPPQVRREILASWQRSLELGVDAGIQRSRKITDENEMFLRRERNAALRQAASAAFRRLEPHLREARTILILADDQGIIIDAIGDEMVLDEGQDIHLEIGGDWTEKAVGTNGIGTALKTGTPTYVHAAEHFAEGVQAWTCAGVPIRDPFSQSVIGVVDLSGPPHIFRQHNIALVLAAAREIEIALAEQQRLERTQLLEAFLLSDYSRMDNSVLLLDCSGRILFRKGLDEPTHRPIADLAVGYKLLPQLSSISEKDLQKFLPPSIEAQALEMLSSEGVSRGAALFLKSQRTSGALISEARRLKPRRNVSERHIDIVGTSPAMLEAIELAERAARANVSVLIQGETGVGKELFARLIHSRMSGDETPYVPVNCAAISNELIGAELFGYVEGAFTGAARGGRAGKFEQADGGVLCLDEIGDMPIELQPYLLRALEQRAIYRMGDSQRRPVDVRLVAMTNRDLRREIERGTFRRDLFYRISVVSIEVPPLRQRGDDLLTLIEHFSTLCAEELGRPKLAFSQEALLRLAAYQWPGNVRELRNVVQRVHLVGSGNVVRVKDLPPEIQEDFEDHDADGLGTILKGNYGDLESIEANAIRRTLVAENGNLTKAASVLGISRPTLYRKMKQYHIERT
ncbi:sigma-54-dependent Fis family transcriptional regulator (plasmid) [Salipiger sp. H15]|uniref:Nif-specific regulatory protein n=1 Tax=Alloyangia sp. H15 TaxID=3029062 RepID=A0AAU8ATG9_9RHOB